MSNKTKSEYPAWICLECGLKYGNKTTGNHDCTWHPDTCGVCGEKTIVTEPRDFGHLKPGWEKLSPSEGQGAPCPEAVNHGDALDCSPSDGDHLPIMDLSIKEIAEILDMPIPTIRDTVNKIRIEKQLISGNSPPTEILEAAAKVSEWMYRNGYEYWELGGTCDRRFANHIVLK